MGYARKKSAQSSRYKRTSRKPAAKRKGSDRKTTAKKPKVFTKRQLAQYVQAVKAKRNGEEE